MVRNQISIVTSLYNSASYIEDFYNRHLEHTRSLNLSCEFVFVNDGSPDHSAAVVKNLIHKDPSVRLVNLSRNFGQHAAMFAGMESASSPLIYTADCDLEEDPANIKEMYKIILNEPELDVIFGVIEDRNGGIERGLLSRIFYALLSQISEVKIVPHQGWQRIMRASYVRALLQYRESDSLPAGLMALAGFNQRSIVIEKSYKGSSSYSFRRRAVLAVNSVTSFSSKPLVWISLFGFFVTAISLLFIFGIIVSIFSGHSYLSGWASLIASIWCVGGLVMTSVGIVGIYLSKVFTLAKRRPLFIIKEILDDKSIQILKSTQPK